LRLRRTGCQNGGVKANDDDFVVRLVLADLGTPCRVQRRDDVLRPGVAGDRLGLVDGEPAAGFIV
jgi:hypothetical protein